MRRATAVILAATLGLLSGCLRQSERGPQPETRVASEAPPGSPSPPVPARGETMPQGTALTTPAIYAAPPAAPVDRKVIRNAELTLELSTPAEGKRKIEAMAESYGGFVVSSEATGSDEAGARTLVTVVVRLPAAKFVSALEEIRNLGYKIKREKITGQDVTEEYIDLEARLKAKRAVEAQFLEIVKQARQVSEALEVQKALGEVRGEIEQIEGRRRFLENQVNLSTLTITLQTPAPLMSTSGPGFIHGMKQAFGEGFDAALEVVLWLIRFALVLIPIVIFVVLPAAFLWRRIRRRKQPQARAQQQS